MPFWVLRIKSSFFYLILYYVIGYRKNVVLNNLKNSFPEKSNQEIKKISKEFYLHFCDVIFETVKLLTISKSAFKKHCYVDDESIKKFNHFFDNNQTIVGVVSHCGNWEWTAITQQAYFPRMLTGAYHPLSNKNFNDFILHLRTRFGGDMVPMQQLYKRVLELREKKIPTTIGLLADQSAPPESAYWTIFLNQDTGIYNGPEKLAKKFNYPVVFLNMKKIRRSYYALSLTILTEHPNSLAAGGVTELHVKELEKNIQAQPYTWLWSHKRWKHKKPESLI